MSWLIVVEFTETVNRKQMYISGVLGTDWIYFCIPQYISKTFLCSSYLISLRYSINDQNRTEQNFIYTQAVIYGIREYLQWTFHILVCDKMVEVQSHLKKTKKQQQQKQQQQQQQKPKNDNIISARWFEKKSWLIYKILKAF